jgi:RecB family exonuclease
MGCVQQLGFEGMPKRLYACTPTRLSTWLDCPRRYRMTYLDRPPPAKGPPWAHNSLGASVHNALAGWWRLPRARRTVAASGDLLDQGWIGEGFADSLQSARYRHWARGLVEAYVTGLDPANEPIGVERTVATRTDLIAVSGRIDRLDDRRGTDGSGELVVVDYKTGRHVLTVDDARTSLPLALYALAAARVMRRPCRQVELHHLPTGRVLAWEHTDESLARQLRRAEDIAAECAEADQLFRGGTEDKTGPSPGLPDDRVDEVFPPRPGSWCGWCDYRARCAEGSEASEPRRPWDGLGTGDATGCPAASEDPVHAPGPRAGERSAGEPDALGPGAGEPDALGPGAGEPDALGPGAGEPDALGPGAAESPAVPRGVAEPSAVPASPE